MDTPNDVITSAFGRSTKNTRGKLATDATELLRIVNQSFRYWWAFGCRINWPYFGAELDVAPDDDGEEPPAPIRQWTRPVTAEAVAFVKMPLIGGERQDVAIVPLNEPMTDGRPALYRIGTKYKPADGADEPTAARTLTFFFARKAPIAAAADDDFDAAWPREYSDLLAIDVAGYLATKDGRAEELAGLGAERDKLMDAFRMFLEHEQMNVEQRFWNARLPAITPMTPVFESPGSKKR